MSKKIWLVYALITTITWGFWGALSQMSMENEFPETLVYCIWALTMLLPGIVVLKINNWKIQYDGKSLLYGSLIRFLGAGGQVITFSGIKSRPSISYFPDNINFSCCDYNFIFCFSKGKNR